MTISFPTTYSNTPPTAADTKAASANVTQPIGDADQAANAVSAAAATPAPSTIVSLSADAKVYATLASQGVTVTQSSLNGLSQPAAGATDGFAKLAMLLAKSAVSATTDGTKYTGTVSKNDFAEIVKQFGATQSMSDDLYAGLDHDSNGGISHDAFLKALSRTVIQPDDHTTHALLKLLDTDHSASVDGAELIKFETAFTASEKSTL